MKRLTREQQKAVVAQWKRAAPALARARKEELAAWQYDAATVAALLDIGAKSPRKEEEPNGLVEMQRWFMKLARKQGLLPAAVREERSAYSVSDVGGGAGGPPVKEAGQRPAPLVRTLGDTAILDRPKVALLCSAKCPGKLILDTYDLAKLFRETGVTVVSGFHSPMEEECLRILLRSPHPVVWCLARGILKRIPSKPVDRRAAVAEGRLLIVSAFKDTVRHVTAETATTRNRLVADLAAVVVVPHAAPGSKIEALSMELLAAGKRLYTFEHPANAALLQAGAHPIASNTDWAAAPVP